jgi:hypothetical protein
MATTMEKNLLKLERQYWQALKDKDVDACLDLTDEPCIITGPQGVGEIDHQTYKQMMNDATYEVLDFQIDDDVKVRMLGRNTAILAYKVREKMTVDGEPVTIEAADTSTWVRRDGDWKCALHTESIAGDPFGRDKAT